MLIPQAISVCAEKREIEMQDSVLVLYTGGTLGMLPSAEGLVPGSDIEARLRHALKSLPLTRQQRLPEFTLHCVAQPIDSSSATPRDWQLLAGTVAQHISQYAGIVILHGTDTLAWTASSLAYQLQGLDRPVILTGAMLPLEARDSDALDNVEFALRCAIMPQLREVAVAFCGELLRGVRTCKMHSEAANAFTSPNYPRLGQRCGDDITLVFDHLLCPPETITPHFELADYSMLGNVVRLTLWPGIQAWQLDAWLSDTRVCDALLDVWGAGNLPADPALLEVLSKASSGGKLLAAVSQCPAGGIVPGQYAASQGLTQAGVLSGADMTPAAALTKLIHLLALPLEQEERRHRFATPLVGECTIKSPLAH